MYSFQDFVVFRLEMIKCLNGSSVQTQSKSCHPKNTIQNENAIQQYIYYELQSHKWWKQNIQCLMNIL